MADNTFLIAAKATGADPDDWTEVETLLSNASADVTLRALDWEFQTCSRVQRLGDGTDLGRGSPRARWTFGGLRPEQRENLKDFCSGLTAEVYIRTPENETTAGVRDWGDYLCIMHWTAGPELVGTEWVEQVEMVFTHLADVPGA